MERKWIVFKASGNEYDWRNRKFQHSGSLTNILAEHFDSSNSDLPEVGYRPPEFLKLDDSDPLGGKTHYRKSDWEVVRVETYSQDLPMSDFGMIVICYCEYNPIESELKPMPERKVSIDSFGGDEEAYKRWSNKSQHVGV